MVKQVVVGSGHCMRRARGCAGLMDGSYCRSSNFKLSSSSYGNGSRFLKWLLWLRDVIASIRRFRYQGIILVAVIKLE